MGEYLYEDYFTEECYEFVSQKLEEIKAFALSNIRKEHVDKMDKLIAENKELREFRDRKEEIENEYSLIVANLEEETRNAKSLAKKARLKELFGDNFVEAWGTEIEYIIKPKCDKCDENRLINFKSPTGRELSEPCECDKKTQIYKPLRLELVKIEEYLSDSGYYYAHYKGSNTNGERILAVYAYRGQAFEGVCSDTYFLDKETCQAYCDWKNNKNKGNL
jgi:hypothetical protein